MATVMGGQGNLEMSTEGTARVIQLEFQARSVNSLNCHYFPSTSEASDYSTLKDFLRPRLIAI
jgi:hypothetical protein